MKKDINNLNNGHRNKIIGVISTFLVVIFIVGSKLYTNAITKAVAFANPPLSNERITDTSYLDQLSKHELDIYETIMDRIANFDDGVIDFGEPITEIEFTRIRYCVEIYNGDNEYAMLVYPMNEDNNVLYDTSNTDLENGKAATLQKCLLVLYPSEVMLEDIEISEDGYVKNLDEFENDAINSEKKDKVLDLEKEGIRILDEVVKGVPVGAGQRDALEYLKNWMIKNLVYDLKSYNELNASFTKNTTENWYNLYYVPSSLSCVVKGKAMCLGFSKTLAYLCNSVGIKAKVIICSVTRGIPDHAIVAVQIEDKTAYFDLSVTNFNGDIGKALNKTEVENSMDIYNYFTVK